MNTRIHDTCYSFRERLKCKTNPSICIFFFTNPFHKLFFFFLHNSPSTIPRGLHPYYYMPPQHAAQIGSASMYTVSLGSSPLWSAASSLQHVFTCRNLDLKWIQDYFKKIGKWLWLWCCSPAGVCNCIQLAALSVSNSKPLLFAYCSWLF